MKPKNFLFWWSGERSYPVFIIFGKELVINMFIVETDIVCKGNEHIREG